MLKIAIYGKGGIGKSTIASHLSASFASLGKRVMQIGCDPKTDSTMNLLGGEPPIPILRYLEKYGAPESPEEILKIGFKGVTCVEVGGPTPGLGCAGRGIITALEVLDELGVYEKYKPDVIIYDVLGDVVCGGFAVPMREGYAEKVLIVTSGEKLSLYAAQNIIQAIENFKDRNYAKLEGLVLNRRNIPQEIEKVEKFAKKMGTQILGIIPRDEFINKAELEGKTAIELNPEHLISKTFFELAKKLLNSKSQEEAC
ncbi:MAG: Nitrogenase ATPase subunit NifH/coenzyme F430 biosynthesis subunit CfbC [Thermodesulfobacterium sp.]|uniref:Nitrogenase ATPase subunit NifH/coenzyme F430 biosynthesis subunit CfbC n=1 Tax=Candidatus Thermodesulfobacterium syntrophicum TaxID=3060442 RepID=A0AAE3P424_9BACT|nr:Nitrogenase ATPase subunit NifH/coenzyme F430 biosynthesis subunit CfbC [Candidatus Thermodesulfobacterium syntrophicum]